MTDGRDERSPLLQQSHVEEHDDVVVRPTLFRSDIRDDLHAHFIKAT